MQHQQTKLPTSRAFTFPIIIAVTATIASHFLLCARPSWIIRFVRMQALASVDVNELDKASRELKPPVAIRVSVSIVTETGHLLLESHCTYDFVTV